MYLYFFSSNWSSWGPDSRVKIVLLKTLLSRNYLSLKIIIISAAVYPTMGKIQWGKSFCVVGYSTPHKILLRCGYNGRKTPALWDKTKKHLCYIPLRKKNYCVVGYSRKKFVSHPEIVVPCILQWKKNFFRCIPQWRKTFSIVSHYARNAAELYPTMEKKC